MPAPKYLTRVNPGFKKSIRRYATSKSGEKQAKEGVGVWAQPIVARRSPRRAATRPEEARIGAEADSGPWRPEMTPGGLKRGPGRPTYPRPLPPSFSSLNSAFLPVAVKFALLLSNFPAIWSAGGANSSGSAPAIFPFSLAALAANSTLVHDVCRWVERRGARREAVGERSSATEPDRRKPKATARDVRAQGDGPAGGGDRRFAGRAPRRPDRGDCGLTAWSPHVRARSARAREDMNMKGTFRCAWQSKTKKIDL
jgi:hypothetical protein